MKRFGLILTTTLWSATSVIAMAQTAPSLFFDETMPIGNSNYTDIFTALKTGQISELYVRPDSYDKTLRSSYQVSYVNDFEACTDFDDTRTLYQSILTYELSAVIFNKKTKTVVFMKEPNSADFVNGECLLAKRADAPQTDFIVTTKSKKKFTRELRSRDGQTTIIPNLDYNMPTILTAMGIPTETKPYYKASESNIGKVSDANMVRALTSDNDTMRQTALYLLANRVKPYGSEYVITEPTESPDVLEALLGMDYLKSIDEITRAATLNAIGVVMTEVDSTAVKAGVLSALEAQYPLKIAKTSRELGKQFGIEFPPEGELRPGHRSQKILLGAAMALHRMTPADREDILSRYPESFEKFYGGTYKSMKQARLLRELVEG